MTSCDVIWLSIPACKLNLIYTIYQLKVSQENFMTLTCNLTCTCIFLGWCLDLYGTDGYIIRSMLQAYLWHHDGDYTWGYSRNDFISSMFFSSYCVIVHVRLVLKRTVFGDWRFNTLIGSHLQSQVNSVCQSMVLRNQ